MGVAGIALVVIGLLLSVALEGAFGLTLTVIGIMTAAVVGHTANAIDKRRHT